MTDADRLFALGGKVAVIGDVAFGVAPDGDTWYARRRDDLYDGAIIRVEGVYHVLTEVQVAGGDFVTFRVEDLVHGCLGLERSPLAIRYEGEGRWSEDGFHLWIPDDRRPLAYIEFCPFCGVKLRNPR